MPLFKRQTRLLTSPFLGLTVLCCLLLVACGGGGGGGGGGSSSNSRSHSPKDDGADFSDLTPYQSAGIYASVLKNCALAERPTDSCSFSQLPLLVVDSPNPTVADIMSRVLVSHNWMGLRFEQVLQTMPVEILDLFVAVTTIVIDDAIRPSYYQAQTSTIFLDPAFLWLTNAEKSVISQHRDYRSDFANDLAFVSMSRSVSYSDWDDTWDYAWDYYPLDGSDTRQLDDIRLALASLLLHELMHANDYFPPKLSPDLASNITVYDAYQQLAPQRISAELDNDTPLQSQLLKDLAAVMYSGATATAAQRVLSAADVGAEFELDGASDDYGYTTAREDVAMLFSEAMMKYLFDIDRDIAYSNRPAAGADCDSYLVQWGVRGRIADSNVRPRAQFVLEEVYPAVDFSLFFQNLALPRAMNQGLSWCDNLTL